jgi:hypothetical protein
MNVRLQVHWALVATVTEINDKAGKPDGRKKSTSSATTAPVSTTAPAAADDPHDKREKPVSDNSSDVDTHCPESMKSKSARTSLLPRLNDASVSVSIEASLTLVNVLDVEC